MGIINSIFQGFITISLLALIQHGCSVKDMAGKAADAHKKGLSSYGGYFRILTGQKRSWAKPEF